MQVAVLRLCAGNRRLVTGGGLRRMVLGTLPGDFHSVRLRRIHDVRRACCEPFHLTRGNSCCVPSSRTSLDGSGRLVKRRLPLTNPVTWNVLYGFGSPVKPQHLPPRSALNRFRFAILSPRNHSKSLMILPMSDNPRYVNLPPLPERLARFCRRCQLLVPLSIAAAVRLPIALGSYSGGRFSRKIFFLCYRGLSSRQGDRQNGNLTGSAVAIWDSFNCRLEVQLPLPFAKPGLLCYSDGTPTAKTVRFPARTESP